MGKVKKNAVTNLPPLGPDLSSSQLCGLPGNLFRWLLLLLLVLPVSANSQNQAVTTLTHSAANYLAQGALDYAAHALERALRIEPENAELWHLLAQVQHYRADYAGARGMAEKSLTLSDDDVGLKARNAWLIALGDQASQGSEQADDAKREAEEQLRQSQQAERVSRQEIDSLKGELQTERERHQQLLASVAQRSDAKKQEETARISAGLQRVSAARRQSEQRLTKAEEESHRLSNQLQTARAELEEANRLRISANKARKRVEAALEKSMVSHSALERQLAATAKTASKRNQTGVVRKLKEKLESVSRELETSRQEQRHAMDELVAERNERQALEGRLAERGQEETPTGKENTIAGLRDELAAEHEYGHELEEKIRNYRERLYKQGRELRSLRRTVARTGGALERVRDDAERPLLAARTDYRAWRKYRRSGRQWNDD